MMTLESPLPAAAIQSRTVVLVIPDADLRQRLSDRLTELRWNVLQAGGGAEAMAHLDGAVPEAMIVDHWLPDLDADEFKQYAGAICPGTDLIETDGRALRQGNRSPRRNELLHALREVQDEDLVRAACISDPTVTRPAEREGHAVIDGAAWLSAPVVAPAAMAPVLPFELAKHRDEAHTPAAPVQVRCHLPDVAGDSPAMVELAAMVRTVAPHTASVLIHGETGTGKELIAKALHRLSPRSAKPFVVLNCAAIPEHLLEAELFGHTRGAFTGAVASRTGRIEAAHGGTLFLDEIGEMPIHLQAKLLRFLESGEIQRVGDNDVSRVDVRIVSATHQPLEENAERKLFRLDLYHRLAVFPVDVPALRDRLEDLPMLVEHLLARFGASAPRHTISDAALDLLRTHPWPGNVRELCHVLQRACILAGDSSVIQAHHIRMRRARAA